MSRSRSPEESVRWLLTSSIDVRTVKARLHEVDSVEDLRTWVRVYNEVRDQLPPGRKDALIDAIERRHNQLAD